MECQDISLGGVQIHNCAFIDGTVYGIIGVYRATTADTHLVNQIRAAAVGR